MKTPFKNFKISLKLKIASLFVFLVIAMMITVTYIFTIGEMNVRVEQVKLRMERLANNIATIRSVETEDWDVYQTYIDNQLKPSPDIVYVAIFDEKDELKVHALNTEWIDLGVQQQLDKYEQANIVRKLDQRQIAEESQKDLESKAVNIIIGEQNLGTVKVGFSLVELNDEMRNNLTRNFQLAIIFIILAIVTSFFMSHRIVTPLGKLTNAMLKISRGDLNQDLRIKSRDEIGEMAKTFNYMAKGLQEKEMIENFSRELGFSIKLEKILSLITKRITLALNTKSSYLFLRGKNQPFNFHLISAYPKSSRVEITLDCSQSLCKYFQTTPNPQPLSNFRNYSEFLDQLKIIKEIRDYSLISPIIIKEVVIGLFLLSAKKREVPYTKGEKKFLSTLIRQGGFAIENALLYEDLTEQERLKRELEIARLVQQKLLPQTKPQIAGLDIDGVCIPAAEIGGDYYDYFLINNHTIGIAIADVTGKGTSAAFYMAVVKGIMLSLTSIFTSPKQLLSELNRRLYGKMDRKIFITMIYAIIDLRKKVLKFARAGHNALIVRNAENSSVECLTPDGIGLGLEQGDLFDSTISEQHIKFQTGDAFIFYTDGISEAMNGQREEFGEERLVDIIVQTNHQSSAFIRERIIDTINTFAQGAPQHDDITMVTVTAT